MPKSTRAENQTHKWTDAFGKPIDCICRFGGSLVGLSHPNKRGLDRRALVQSISRGSKLQLVPEPDNPVDRNAILVYRADDREYDLGYLHSSTAKRICRMIECGATFSAEVYWVNRDRKDFPEVYFNIYQLTPMTSNKRPTRRGAPTYKPELPKSRKRQVPNDEEPPTPLFQFVNRDNRSKGLLGWIRRIFG